MGAAKQPAADEAAKMADGVIAADEQAQSLRFELAESKAALADAEAANASLRADLKAAKAAGDEHAKARESAEQSEKAAREQLAQSRSELRAAEAMIDEMQEQIRIRPLAPGARAGKPLFFAKCAIHMGEGRVVEVGGVLPFDPTDPPSGFDGFVEGTHYEKR